MTIVLTQVVGFYEKNSADPLEFLEQVKQMYHRQRSQYWQLLGEQTADLHLRSWGINALVNH